MVDAVFGDSSLLNQTIALGKDSFASAVLVAGAGVPIGYMLYQFYFYIRWNAPLSGSSFLFLQGRTKGIQETLKGVPLQEWPIISSDPLSEPVAYLRDFQAGKASDYRRAWYYMETLLIEFSSQNNKAGMLNDRSRYLMDMLHALGTGIYAILLGWLSFIFAKVYVHLSHLLPFQTDIVKEVVASLASMSTLISTLVTIAILVFFQANRINTRNQMVTLQNYMFRRMFFKKTNSDDDVDQ